MNGSRVAAEMPSNQEPRRLVVAGADHAMMLGVDSKHQVDPKFFPKEAPDAPAYFALLGAWLVQHGFAR